MTISKTFKTKVTKFVIRNFRKAVYGDMARQASDWIPEEARAVTTVRKRQPIKLDFAVPKKHRLTWSLRTVRQLPH
jgi:hypothetical protein